MEQYPIPTHVLQGKEMRQNSSAGLAGSTRTNTLDSRERMLGPHGGERAAMRETGKTRLQERACATINGQTGAVTVLGTLALVRQ